MILTKTYTYAIALVIGCVLVYGGIRYYKGRQVAVHVAAADKLDVQQVAAGAEATPHEQTATNLKPTLQANAAAVAQASAVVAHLQHPNSPAGAQQNQPATDPQPVQAPVDLAALDAAKDVLIAALKKANADLTASNDAWEAGDTARQTQVRLLQGEVVQLRAAIAAMPKDLKWAVGPVYGSDHLGDTAKGMAVHRDFSVVRTALEVTKNNYVFANRQAWEGRLSLLIRF
jgi:hypothetical protein